MPFLGLAVTQILLAFVSATILHRIVLRRFFLRWMASHKFVCWLAPTNNELLALKRGSPGDGKKARRRNRAQNSPSPGKENGDAFKIAATNLDSLKLNSSVLTFLDFDLLHGSYDLEWMVDLAMMSLFSFCITELLFYSLSRADETNLSQLWIALVIAYSILNLWRLTKTYFINEQSTGERSICIVSACFFMLIAMLILIVDESKLEFGLETAYSSFNQSATAFVTSHKLAGGDPNMTRKPMSFLLIKLTMAVLCALTGMVFTFPAFRYAQLHRQLFESPEESKLTRFLCLVNFASPLVVALLWVRPLTRDLINSQNYVEISNAMYDSFRIYFIIMVNFIKFFSMPKYVAVFLKSVHPRLWRLRRRGGSTNNQEVQLTITSIYNYVNIVTIQLIVPTLMCLATILLYKTLGGHSWLPFSFNTTTEELPQNLTSPSIQATTPPMDDEDFDGASSFVSNDNLTAVPKTITLTEIKSVFSHDVCQGVMGFATWWLHFSWFLSSSAGVVYHTYFIH